MPYSLPISEIFRAARWLGSLYPLYHFMEGKQKLGVGRAGGDLAGSGFSRVYEPPFLYL